MFERWLSLTQNLGQEGSEGGTIVHDEELPEIGRVAIERKTNLKTGSDYFGVTIGVYGTLVHTAFFSSLEDALEGMNIAKILIQVLVGTTANDGAPRHE
jgi:hypothetical protein